MPSIKRALLSVSDKTNLIPFATQLTKLGIQLLSTGGTSALLKEANIPHRLVEEVTGVQEMMDGRVKTLHPKIHGGILGDRIKHHEEMSAHGIDAIDLVIVNFYPFHKVLAQSELPLSAVIEEIDIGGPAMVRAAAKNMAYVSVVVDPNDYQDVIQSLLDNGDLLLSYRQQLALKAYKLTAQYDAMVSSYLETRFNHSNNALHSKTETLLLKESIALRYGENPHQRAHAFQIAGCKEGVLTAMLYQGKALSFNNLLDANAAFNCLTEFDVPTAVIVKHGNPCGVAARPSIEEAYNIALKADASSAFGGIVALNRPCGEVLASTLIEHFLEVVIAPSFSEAALSILAKKPNLRVLAMPMTTNTAWEYKFIEGGVLKQEKDRKSLVLSDLKVVTNSQVDQKEMDEMLFAWHVLKHLKSNAILITANNTTLGIGAGQVSRIDSVDIAIKKAGNHLEGAVLASDAFFPFRDSIDRIAKAGIRAIIQPGGSVKDQEVIDACNEHGMAMVFTGVRCFKH